MAEEAMAYEFIMHSSKLVEYWHPDHGAGVTLDGERDHKHWTWNDDGLEKTFHIDDPAMFEPVLRKHLEKFGFDLSKDFTIFEDGRLTGNRVELGDCTVVTGEQEREALRRKQQLYLCTYDLYIEVRRVTQPVEPTIAELAQFLPTTTIDWEPRESENA